MLNVSKGISPSAPKMEDNKYIQLIKTIFLELPVATKDNEWISTTHEIEDINTFRVGLSRYSKSFLKAVGEERKFSTRKEIDSTYRIWRLQ